MPSTVQAEYFCGKMSNDLEHLDSKTLDTVMDEEVRVTIQCFESPILSIEVPNTYTFNLEHNKPI